MEQGALQQQPAGAAAAPRLRPRDVGEKLDAAIKLTLRHFGTLATIVLILLLPISLLSFLITISTLPEDFTAGGQFGGGATPEDGSDWTGAYVAGQLVVYVLQFLAFYLVPAACLQAVGQAYLGERSSWRESLGFALRRLHSILWIVLLIGLGLVAAFFVGLVLLGIAALFPLLLLVALPLGMGPALYLVVSWSLALPALLLEGKRGGRALGRSHSLVQGRWWRTFVLLGFAWLLVFLVSLVGAGAITAVVYVVSDESTVTAIGLNFLANLVVSVLTTPVLATVTIVLYFDLRVRKEGFDLRLLAGAIRGRPASEALEHEETRWVPPGWGPRPWGGPPPGWGPPPVWGPPAPGWAPPPPHAGPPPQGWGGPVQGPAPPPRPAPLWAPPAPPPNPSDRSEP